MRAAWCRGVPSFDLSIAFTYNPAGQLASQSRSNDLYAWTGLEG